MISYVFLGLFAAAAVVNLIGAAKGNAGMSNISKPVLLSSLCLYVLFSGLPAPDFLFMGALSACFLGDVLLMLNGDVWFTAGGVSFFAGHVMLIFIFARYVNFGRLPLAAIIPAAALYLFATVFVMARSYKKAPKLMFVPLLLYLVCNSVMNLFAMTRMIAEPSFWSVLSFVGAVLFFLSDCILFLCRYDEEHPRFYKTDFYVMLTYISGVCFITVGLVPFLS